MKLKRHSVHILKTKNGMFEYCRFGRGKPMVLIMGYATTMNAWNWKFLQYLSNFNEVIVFNNRNTGSVVSGEPFETIPELAGDVLELVNKLELENVTVVGYSMGGMVAQSYASNYPDSLSKLVIINSAPPGDLITRPSEDVLNTLRSLKRKNILAYLKLMSMMLPSIWYAPILHLNHFRPSYKFENTIPEETIIRQQGAIEKWSEEESPTELLAKIITPTLIFVGGSDLILPPDNCETMHKHIINSKLIKYINGTHGMIYQYPKKMADTIVKFVAGEEGLI
jgi:pimeloyl-ACP methyl ester carboxylesterase